MALNKKDILLLEEINNNPCSIKYFADKYKVSERNVRYSVDNINFYLKKENIDEVEIKLGNLEFSTEKNILDKFIKNLNMNTYAFSSEERESYILTEYLFKKNITIKDIENFLHVSRTTIKKDIKNMEDYLAQFDLHFERYENKIEISGNEKKLRHLKLLKMLNYAEIKNNQINFISKKYFNENSESKIIEKYLNKYFKKELLDAIEEIEKNLGSSFPQEFKNIMALYLTATSERIENGYIIDRKSNSEFLRGLNEHKIIKNILKKIINENYEYEFLHLTEYFLSGEYVNFFYENLFIAERFISRLLRALEKTLNMKFITNKDLAENLLKYLVPAIYRIKNNFYLHKDFEIFIRTSKVNKNIMSAVKEGVLENNKYLLEPLRDEEILYIAEAIEEFIKNSKIKKVSLKKLMDIVEENSDNCCSEKIINNIKEEFGILIDDDLNSVDNYNISNLLNKDRIFIYPKAVSVSEAADRGINILVDRGFVRKDMLYNLRDLIQKFGKYMFIDKKILFCYNTNPENFLKSGLAVVISEKGIQVPESEDGNILFILSAENKIEHLKIISDLINLAENSSLEEIILFLKAR